MPNKRVVSAGKGAPKQTSEHTVEKCSSRGEREKARKNVPEEERGQGGGRAGGTDDEDDQPNTTKTTHGENGQGRAKAKDNAFGGLHVQRGTRASKKHVVRAWAEEGQSRQNRTRNTKHT